MFSDCLRGSILGDLLYPLPFLAPVILFSEDRLLSLASSAATLEPRLPEAMD